MVTMAIFLGATAQADPIRYVDDDALPGGDGASWETAFRFLQDALSASSRGDLETAEIHIAQGFYVTDRDEANPGGTGDRLATFQLINGVALKGGYAGLGAEDPDQRDLAAFETVLSGDLLGDDGNAYGNYGENSYHVVTGTGTDATAVLDGVTLRSGNADEAPTGDPNGRGGGLHIEGGSPLVNRCTFFKNQGKWGAAAATLYEGRPTFTECRFVDNHALGQAGALSSSGDGAIMIDCTIEQNVAEFGGGGIKNGGTLTLLRCTLTDNVTIDSHGGALYISGGAADARTLIMDCLFTGNCGGRGGGIYSSSADLTVVNSVLYGNCRGMGLWGGYVVIVNSTVTGNTISTHAGGIWAPSASCEIANSIVWGNTPYDLEYGSTFIPVVNNSNITGAPPEGMQNIDAEPLFIDPENGDFRLSLGSPCIDRGLEYSLPEDELDLDGDGNTTEPIPFDLDGNDRVTNLYPDVGAYEFQGPFGPPGDIDGDGTAGVLDFLILLESWGFCCAGDFDCDQVVENSDLVILLDMLGPCPPGPCPADLNGDGQIDTADVTLFLDIPYGPCPNCYADLDGDCRVGVTDVLLLLANWS
jgi:hypothetical protein